MTGRLHERDGKYTVILEYKDKNKKQKQKWVSTGYEVKGNKKKAEAKLNEFIEQYRYLEYNESYKPLFVDAVQEWLKNKENKVERSTHEGYKSYINFHIIPYFEALNLRFDEVTPKHIKDFYETKFKSGKYGKEDKGGLSVRSIRKLGAVLKQIFKEAVITEQITRNPANNVPYPTNEKSEFKGSFLTGDEANKLLQAFSGHELQAIIYVTLYYGLRRSEALGLRWQAIDFEAETLTINHTVVKVLTTEYKDKTKSKTSLHTFKLLPEVKELLLKLKKQQDADRRIFKTAYIESDYIFKWQNGKLYRPEYITRAFQRVLKNSGLTRMRYHDLRHSTASILHDKGWSLKDIQNWLRHADIETTGNIYTHISKSREQANAKDLEKTFII